MIQSIAMVIPRGSGDLTRLFSGQACISGYAVLHAQPLARI